MICYAQLPIATNLQPIQWEVKALSKGWQAHFNIAHYEGSWQVLPLRSPGGLANSILPDLTTYTEYANTKLLLQCPAIAQLLAGFNCPLQAVRLLNLTVGALIKPHRDADLAFERGEARLHIPIFTNPSVEFMVDGDMLTMQEGYCWYINANLTHCVANKGSTDRIHLVIDCTVNPWLKTIFAFAEKIKKRTEMLGPETPQIIAQLKNMRTNTSLKMAFELEKKWNTL